MENVIVLVAGISFPVLFVFIFQINKVNRIGEKFCSVLKVVVIPIRRRLRRIVNKFEAKLVVLAHAFSSSTWEAELIGGPL